MFFLFLFFSVGLGAMEFHSFGGGEWGDAVTWWGNIFGPVPGPEDDVFISAGTEVLGGGDCHNLTIESAGGFPGRLTGHHGGYDGCRIRGDLVCDGYLIPGSGGGIYELELWGNLTVSNLFRPTNLHLTGSSMSITDQVSIAQSPGATIHTVITVAMPFPGIKLLSDFSLDSNDGYHVNGTLTGAEIYLNGFTISRSTLINCYFLNNPDCTTGSIADCKLSNVQSWIQLTNLGTTDLLNNQCVFNGDFINNGTLNGPISMSGSFECSNLTNNGILQAGWNGSLNTLCHGNIINNHTLKTDLVWTAEVVHTWTEGAGSYTEGNYVNLSPGLILLSDLTLQTGNTFYTGVLNLNGHCLHNTTLINGHLNGDSGALDSCNLSTVDVFGEIYITGICQLLNSDTVFNGSTCVTETLAGCTSDNCSTAVHGLFYNYGTISPGWNGQLYLTLGDGFSNHGSTTADLITFSGSETQYLNWSEGAVFAFDILNQCPELVLMGSSLVNANNKNWNLGTCTLAIPQQLSFINLTNSVIGGGFGLYLNHAILTNMQFEVPVTVQEGGVQVTGTDVSFAAELTLLGQLAGENWVDNSIYCESNLIVSGGSLNDGYSGRLTAFLDADLIVYNGDVVLYNLIFGTGPLHQVAQYNSGSHFSFIADTQSGQTLKLLTDLEVGTNSLFRLNGGILDLNSHLLTLARLNGGTAQSGNLFACNLAGMQLADITLNDTNNLEDNNCVASGSLTVQGALVSMNWEAAQFTVLGDIYNNGLLSGGYGGSLAVLCFGNIANCGTWEADTKLRGTASRNLSLNTPGHLITIDTNSLFTLNGVNLLSSFTVETGSAITIGAGAGLTMVNPDDFYLANQSGYGSVIDHGYLSNMRFVNGLNPLDYYGLRLTPFTAMAGDYTAVDVSHVYGESPDGIEDTYLEYWSVTPHGQSQIQNGRLCFTHSPDPYRVVEEGLELYYRQLGQSVWQHYNGDFSYSTTEHSYTADDIPVGGEYVFVVGTLAAPENLVLSLQDSSEGKKPVLQWTAVPGASHYRILCSNAPSGPWSFCGNSYATQWIDNAVANRRFYQVLARWGEE